MNHLIACPRCSGCGYADCEACAADHAKRPGCRLCAGTGGVPCGPSVQGQPCGPDGLCGYWQPPGGLCPFCDEPIDGGLDSCSRCVIPVGINLADDKALFAHNDLSLDPDSPR